MSHCCANTDRELWRKGDGDGDGMSYYEPSIHVTAQGNIGINVGGLVFELPVEEWHTLAADKFSYTRRPENVPHAKKRFACLRRFLRRRADSNRCKRPDACFVGKRPQ